MQIQGITAQVKPGDPGPGDVHADFAEVTITLDGDREVSFVIHQSKVYSNTINVEIDGDLTQDDPALRINLNDNLIFDSVRNDPAIDDSREPDLQDDGPAATAFTEADAARLAQLEAAFGVAGGRGVDLAEEIDALRRKRDGVPDEGERDYTVSLSNTFEAGTPNDAVLQMATYVVDNGHSAGYRVSWANDDGTEHSMFVDADDIEVGPDGLAL